MQIKDIVVGKLYAVNTDHVLPQDWHRKIAYTLPAKIVEKDVIGRYYDLDFVVKDGEIVEYTFSPYRARNRRPVRNAVIVEFTKNHGVYYRKGDRIAVKPTRILMTQAEFNREKAAAKQRQQEWALEKAAQRKRDTALAKRVTARMIALGLVDEDGYPMFDFTVFPDGSVSDERLTVEKFEKVLDTLKVA